MGGIRWGNKERTLWIIDGMNMASPTKSNAFRCIFKLNASQGHGRHLMSLQTLTLTEPVALVDHSNIQNL